MKGVAVCTMASPFAVHETCFDSLQSMVLTCPPLEATPPHTQHHSLSVLYKIYGESQSPHAKDQDLILAIAQSFALVFQY